MRARDEANPLLVSACSKTKIDDSVGDSPAIGSFASLSVHIEGFASFKGTYRGFRNSITVFYRVEFSEQRTWEVKRSHADSWTCPQGNVVWKGYIESVFYVASEMKDNHKTRESEYDDAFEHSSFLYEFHTFWYEKLTFG